MKQDVKKYVFRLALVYCFTFINYNTISAQKVSSIACVRNNDGSLEVFVARQGNNGAVFHSFQSVAIGIWSPWQRFPAGARPDDDPHALAAGKDRTGRIIVCWISDGTIYTLLAQRPRSGLTTDPHIFRPSASRCKYVTIANNADGKVEIFALDEAGSAWSIKQLANDVNGQWKFAQPRYIGSPTEYSGTKLLSISAAAFDDGKLALVALGEDKVAYWTSQMVAQAPPLKGVPPKLQAGQWSGQWRSLGGHDLQEVKAAESRDHQLEVAAVGGDGIIYLKFQSAINKGTWSEWSPIITNKESSQLKLAGPLLFDKVTGGTLFIISHMDAGDTQYKGTFGKSVQLPNNGGFPNMLRYYHAPGIITDALGGYDPKLLAYAIGTAGAIHFFATSTYGLFVEHYIDHAGRTSDANLVFQTGNPKLPGLPKSN
jgi:hypothetical protein